MPFMGQKKELTRVFDGTNKGTTKGALRGWQGHPRELSMTKKCISKGLERPKVLARVLPHASNGNPKASIGA